MKRKPILPFEQVLTILIVIGCFSYFFSITFFSLPKDQLINANEIRSALLVTFGMVIQFWVGTTKGSQKKSDTIDKMANTANANSQPKGEDVINP